MVDHDKDLASLLSERMRLVEAVRYIVRSPDGTRQKGHQMCFGGLRSMSIKPTDYIINGIQYKTSHYEEVSNEDHKLYLEWLMTESPFKAGFLEHDVDWSMENHVTFHHVNQPGNMMLGALTAVRAMTEPVSCEGYKWFKGLVDAGCTKETAFIFMFYLGTMPKGNLYIKDVSYNGGHTAWGEHTSGKTEVVNFINGNVPGLLPHNFSDTRYFNGVQSLFSENRDKEIPSFCKWLIAQSNKSKAIKTFNNWGESLGTIQSLELPKDEMFAYLASMSERIYKEWIK